jgi:hydrogenase nickel incorporation protein HypA/HybF
VHELSITQSIVELVSDHAAGQKVKRVTLEVGKFAGVMRDAVQFCFDLAAQGTVLEGASLEINEIEGRSLCVECGREFVQEALYTPCPCGAHDFVRLRGEELLVKEYELILDPPPCEARCRV